MALIFVIFYYPIIIPSIILLSFISSLYIYCKFSQFFQDDDDDDENSVNNDDNPVNDDDQNVINLNHSTPSSLSSSSTSKLKKNNDRIVMTKEIDKLLLKIVDNIVEYYVMTWYRPLIVSSSSTNLIINQQQQQSIEQFHNSLRDDIWILISCFIDRLYNVNHIQFISQHLVKRLHKHFLNINNNQDNNQDDHDKKLKTGHRKNQHSISSLVTQLSDSDKSYSTSTSSLNDQHDDLMKSKSKLSTFFSEKQQTLLKNLNPFQNQSINESINDDNDNTVINCKTTTIKYPLASHLFDLNSEKILIKNLTNFILKTLFDDINRGYYNNQLSSSSSSLLLVESKFMQNSQIICSFLNEVFATILFNTIDLISQPKMINYQIVKILKQYFLLKELLFYDDNNQDVNIMTKHNEHNSDAHTDTDDDDDDNFKNKNDKNDNVNDDSDSNNDDDEYFDGKQNVFHLNEAKQCIERNNFDRLYELIDQCNNIKLLKHIRLKLIAEILDAAVVSHLHDDRRQQQRFKSINENSINENFLFNGQINLKFKKFKQEKNIKRLIVRLRFAKTLCEQKIQIRKRTIAELLLPMGDDKMDDDDNSINDDDELVTKKRIRKPSLIYDDSNQSTNLVRSISFDDSISIELSDESYEQQQQQIKKPKEKKIFKFHQIMSNKCFRNYFKTFLERSLLKTDPATTKRSSLMKFRKDVLIVDCTVYMLEFWEQLQLIFYNFKQCIQQKNNNDDTMMIELHKSFENSMKIIMKLVFDQHFSYTFSNQFLLLPTKLMLSLERFLLGDIDIKSLDLSVEHFDLYNGDDNDMFLLKKFNYDVDINYLLKRIDWFSYLDIFVKFDKILFNCFHQEFYPQFLISHEYDQLLSDYFEKKLINNYNNNELLLREQWYNLNNDTSDNDYLRQSLRMKAMNKIILTSNTNNNNNNKKIIDLNKNRRMLLNSIEFPFIYLSTVKLLLIIRLRLKCWIKNLLMNDYNSTITNHLYNDLNKIISMDIDQLKQSIDRLHRILTRTFCWLNADFSCVITDCHFRNDYQQILQSSTANTTESKIMTFVENLFVPQQSSTMLKENPPTSSSSNPNANFLFQLNITALLSRFQYHQNNDELMKKLLPINVRNDLMSNWSYQWSIELSLDRLQQFYQQSLRSFLRFIIYLNQYNLYNYLSIINDHLQHRQQRFIDDKLLKLFLTTPNINERVKLSNFETKILKTFLQRSNQIFNEIRQLNRTMVLSLKKQQIHHFQNQATINQNNQNKNKTTTTISFKNLLKRDMIKNNNDYDVGQDAFELFQNDNNKSTINNKQNQSIIEPSLKRTEKLLNILFQQITAQNLAVKSIGFLQLIGYKNEEIQMIQSRITDDKCLHCLLNNYLFIMNNDDNDNDDLNQLVQIYLFHMLFKYDDRSSLDLLIKHLIINTDDSDDDSLINNLNLTVRLFFTQCRSLLMEKTSKDCFDYCLNQLKLFDTDTDNFCKNIAAHSNISNLIINNNNNNVNVNDKNDDFKKKSFRLFNSQLFENGNDDQSAISSQSNNASLLNIVNVNNIFMNLFRQSSATNNIFNDEFDYIDDDDIVDDNVVIDDDDDDVPLSLIMSLDETQLFEPFFQLLIEIFELKGNTVTRTLRRLLMFVIKLFFGSSKIQRPYKQFLQSLFTEKNVFRLLSMVNIHLETMLMDSLQKSNKLNNKETLNDEETNQIDAYLEQLNHLLCSLENQSSSATTPATPTSVDHEIFPDFKSGDQNFIYSQTTNQNSLKNSNNTQSSLVEDPEESIKERKLQILAKQLLFAATPTIVNHLLGQENIDRGLNKCFDILQYQKLNKHLIYELIEAFMLEYFPEFRKFCQSNRK